MSCIHALQLQLMAKTMLSKIPLPETLAHEQGLLETIWLLFTSVLVVPAVCKIPGGSPVLGFLAGGALIGPHALGEPSSLIGQYAVCKAGCLPRSRQNCVLYARRSLDRGRRQIIYI